MAAARSPVPSTVAADVPGVLACDAELEDDSGELTLVSGEGVFESDADGVFNTNRDADVPGEGCSVPKNHVKRINNRHQ